MTFTLEPTASAADIVSLLVALVALVVSLMALHRSDRTGSAGTLVSLYDSIAEAWRRFLQAGTDSDQSFELAELLNRLEVACALSLGQGIHGASKELLDDYVENSLIAIVGDPGASKSLGRLQDKPTTFKYLDRFIRGRKRWGRMGDVRSAFEEATASDSSSG